jgi:hypothetical protein
MMRDYEPQSDAATRRMLASATGMAAALSFGCVFVGSIVSALLSASMGAGPASFDVGRLSIDARR